MEPWKGSLRGNWKLQSPQICLAFQSQASWRSGAGIRSVEKDCEVFSAKAGDLTRQERFALHRDVRTLSRDLGGVKNDCANVTRFSRREQVQFARETRQSKRI
jgi:hypothetical protein